MAIAGSLTVRSDFVDTFAKTVFGEGLRGIVAVRCFPEQGSEQLSLWTPFIESEQRLVDTLVRYARAAAAGRLSCSVVPGTVARRRAKAVDVEATRVIVVDLDHGNIASKREHLARHLGEPTLEVASGGVTPNGQRRLHLYWQLNSLASGADVGRVCRLREKVAMKVGADPSFQSPHQPIRVPGTIYLKGSVPKVVETVGHCATTFSLDDIERAIECMPALEVEYETALVARNSGVGRRHAAGDPAVLDDGHVRGIDLNNALPRRHSSKSLRSMIVREGGVDGITRHDALSVVIGTMIRQVRRGELTLNAARLAVEDYNRNQLVPPFDEWKVQRDFEALLRRDVERYGPMNRVARGGST